MVYVFARDRTIRSVMEATCWSPVLAQRAVSEEGKGAARPPSCSQNAHDETVLVQCAQ